MAVLAQAVERRAFPGAAFAALRDHEIVLQGAVGRFTYDEGSEDVTLSTVFDLASLTKVVATTTGTGTGTGATTAGTGAGTTKH